MYKTSLTDEQWQVVESFFNKTIDKVTCDELSKYYRIKCGKNEYPSLGIIDSQSSKTTENAETSGYDGNKKIKGRKRQIIVDTLGNLIDINVHDANIHDSKGAELFLKTLKKLPFQLIKIIGDKGYRGEIKNKFLNILNIEFESSEEEKSNIGFIVHSKRWIVERTFAWFGKFLRLCRDYETLNSSVVSFCYLAMIKLLINRLCLKGDLIFKQALNIFPIVSIEKSSLFNKTIVNLFTNFKTLDLWSSLFTSCKICIMFASMLQAFL